jgi:hypothetical protein
MELFAAASGFANFLRDVAAKAQPKSTLMRWSGGQ